MKHSKKLRSKKILVALALTLFLLIILAVVQKENKIFFSASSPYFCDVTSLNGATCFGDTDGDGDVDNDDRTEHNAARTRGNFDNDDVCIYDLDGNGVINDGDRGLISPNIGSCTALPDYQDGSGLNHGFGEWRFGNLCGNGVLEQGYANGEYFEQCDDSGPNDGCSESCMFESLSPPSSVQYSYVSRGTIGIDFLSNPINLGITSYKLYFRQQPNFFQTSWNFISSLASLPETGSPVAHKFLIDYQNSQELKDYIRSFNYGDLDSTIKQTRTSEVSITGEQLSMEREFYLSPSADLDLGNYFPYIQTLNLETIEEDKAVFSFTIFNPSPTDYANINKIAVYGSQEGDENFRTNFLASLDILSPVQNGNTLTGEIHLSGLTPGTSYELFLRPIDSGAYDLESLGKKTTVKTNSITSGVSWTKLNGGNYLDAGEPITNAQSYYSHFSSAQLSDGDLVFTFGSNTLGKILGKLENGASKEWLYWDGSAWSKELPSSFAHPMNIYHKNIFLFPHPSIPQGIMGVASVTQKNGDIGLDTHGAMYNFEFNGIDFRQWVSSTTYDPLAAGSLIRDWTGTSESTFDFDETNKEGILVGTFGYGFVGIQSQLVATRYEFNNPTQRWHSWRNGVWGSSNSWPSFSSAASISEVAILNSDPDSYTSRGFSRPRITHIKNTQDYFITFSATIPNNVLGAALYDDDQSNWKWWNGVSWESGGNYNYASVIPNNLISYEQIFWDDKVCILYYENGRIYEKQYDTATQQFSQPQIIRHGTTSFVSKVDKNGRFWLFYTPDDFNVEKIYREAGSLTWSNPERVYTSENKITFLGLNFVNSGVSEEPIVFMAEEVSDEEHRLIAIAEPTTFWQNEQQTTLQEFSPANNLVGDSSKPLVFKKSVYNGALAPGSSSAAYSGHVGQFEVDESGYVYAPINGFAGIIIQPPYSNSHEGNYRWGSSFSDYAPAPSGAAVDSLRGKLYIGVSIIGTAGGVEKNIGDVLIWDYKSENPQNSGILLRDQSLTSLGSSGSTGFSREYSSSRIEPFSWPSDVAVDEERGRLYVSNSLENRIDVFDIENLVETGFNFPRAQLFEDSISSANLASVQSIVSSLINNNFLDDGGGAGDNAGIEVKWVSGVELSEVISFVKSLQEFSQITTTGYDNEDLIRNIQEKYKEHNDRPQPLDSFGSLGSAEDQFIFPSGIDVDEEGFIYIADTENHRISIWSPTESGAEFSRIIGGKGRGNGGFYFPIDLAIDDESDRIYVSDPQNDQVQVLSKQGNHIYSFDKYLNAEGDTVDLKSPGGIVVSDGNLYIGNRDSVVYFSINNNPVIITEENNPGGNAGGGGGGGGGGPTTPQVNSQTDCVENWVCTDWSPCADEVQTRSCTDSSNCATTSTRPPITRTCDGDEIILSENEEHSQEDNVASTLFESFFKVISYPIKALFGQSEEAKEKNPFISYIIIGILITGILVASGLIYLRLLERKLKEKGAIASSLR